MELREAYRVLELEAGATEDIVGKPAATDKTWHYPRGGEVELTSSSAAAAASSS